MIPAPHVQRLANRLATAPNRLFDLDRLHTSPGRVRLRLAPHDLDRLSSLDPADPTPFFQLLSTAARMAVHTLGRSGTLALAGLTLNVEAADLTRLAEVRGRIAAAKDHTYAVEAVALDAEGNPLAMAKGTATHTDAAPEGDLDREGTTSVLAWTRAGLARGAVFATRFGPMHLN